MRKYRSLLLILLLGVVPIIALLVSVLLYFGSDDPPPQQVVQEPPPPPEPVIPPPVDVLAVARDLDVGALLTSNDVTHVPIAPGLVLSSHLRRDQTGLSALLGSVVRTPLLAGTPLSWSALVRPGQDGFLAAALRPNHRAVTIAVNQETSHAGLISPGDRVDVIFTMQLDSSDPLNASSRTVLENIRVVAVNRRVELASGAAEESGGGQSGQGQTVTLEVLPLEADQLVLATTRGSLSLVLRPLSQAGHSGPRPPTGLRTLLPPPESSTPVRVQVFRGSDREEVLLSE